jgi:hypothetical protein
MTTSTPELLLGIMLLIPGFIAAYWPRIQLKMSEARMISDIARIKPALKWIVWGFPLAAFGWDCSWLAQCSSSSCKPVKVVSSFIWVISQPRWGSFTAFSPSSPASWCCPNGAPSQCGVCSRRPRLCGGGSTGLHLCDRDRSKFGFDQHVCAVECSPLFPPPTDKTRLLL